MSYYKQLGLEREPFSTSPSPEFFYRSLGHNTALQRLEIAIRLRRGLSLIIGDVGTGKTTLSRALIQTFQNEDDFIFFMILDPGYKSEFQFLSHLARMMNINGQGRSTMDLKQALEIFLFQKGVEQNKTVVVLIDEGQKLTRENLEVLRMLLNYETNEFKLLQLVILAQTELLSRLKRVHNFMDRIAMKYALNPLDEAEVKKMIHFRLVQAGYKKPNHLFNDGAIRLIMHNTQGYPRRVSMLCHDAIEALVMKDRRMVDEEIILGLLDSKNRI